MATDPNKKTLRHFQCRDYLWETFEQMSAELECSVDYLINEAMRQYARSRSYGGRGTNPGTTGPASVPPPAPSSQGARESGPPTNAPPPMPQRGSNPAQMPQRPPMNQGPGAPPQRPAIPSMPTGAGPGMPRIPPLGGANIPGGRAPATPSIPMGRGPAPGQIPPLTRPPGGLPPMGRPSAPPPFPGGPGGGMPAPQQRLPPLSSPGGAPPQMPPMQARQPNPGPPMQQQPQQLQHAPPPPMEQPGAAGGVLAAIYQGEKYPVTKEEFIIGRGQKTSDLVIKDSNVSRRHAVVVLHNGQYWMVDQQSTNGVEFMGAKIDRKRIEEGDVFKICDYEVVFTYR